MAASSPLLVNDEEQELEPLTPKQHQQHISECWKWYHTATVLWVRLMMDFTFKNPLIFYLNYEAGLGVSYFSFACILIAGECGCIVGFFVGDLNRKHLGSDELILELYLLVAGVASVCFPVLSWLSAGTVSLMAWCCAARFLVGCAFTFISASSIKLAADYAASPSLIASIIAVLHYSWPLSTALNIAAGYLIEFASWSYVFVCTGCALALTSVGAFVVFRFCPLRRTADDAADDEDRVEEREVDEAEGLRLILTDLKSVLILFVSFFMTFRSRTMYIVTASLWMEETFALSSSLVGWSTLSVVLGEVVGLALMSRLTRRLELWVSAAGTLSHQLVVGAVLFVLAALYGNDITLTAALALTCLLAMGHESFYVVQQANAIHYAPLPRLKLLLLLGERMAQESASIGALLVTAYVWHSYGDDALLVFSVMWIAGTLLESCILFIYRSEPTLKAGASSTQH